MNDKERPARDYEIVNISRRAYISPPLPPPPPPKRIITEGKEPLNPGKVKKKCLVSILRRWLHRRKLRAWLLAGDYYFTADMATACGLTPRQLVRKGFHFWGVENGRWYPTEKRKENILLTNRRVGSKPEK